MKPAIYAVALLSATALPVFAAAPPFETTAPVAYLIDLSSGAVLYAKDADRKMPPASMAKMMTTHVVFDMIKKGELKLDQMITVKPETWAKWHGPAAGSTMFLSPGEQVSVENLLHGIVTLSGNDACVVLAEGISDTEEAFVARMNAEAKKLGIPVIGILDTNCDPDEVTIGIPGNDDAIRSVALLTRVIADAVAEGLIARTTKNEEAAEPLAEWERELLEQSTAAAAETVEAPAAEAAAPAEAEKEAE